MHPDLVVGQRFPDLELPDHRRQPVRLSKLADQLSLGNMDVPDFHARGKDEIGVLADSFNRMKKSLVQAMKMLED